MTSGAPVGRSFAFVANESSTASVRVLALMDTRIISGPGRQLSAIVKPLNNFGFDITIVCFAHRDEPHTPYVRFLEQQGIPYRVVLTSGRITQDVVEQVRKLIAELSPDILQTHSYRPAFIVALLRRAKRRMPWFAFFHGETHESVRVRFYNILDRLLMRLATGVVVVSRSQMRKFPLLKNLRYIPNAVIESGMRSPRTRLHIEKVTGVPLVGFIGRLSSEKGWSYLLQALSLLKARSCCFNLCVAGDGPDRSKFEQLVRRLGLTDRVQLLGHVDDVSDVYESLDLLVLSSVTEGMPNVVLEAMRYNVPVVSTDVGAVRELLSDADAGAVVPSRDPVALANAIAESLCRGKSASGETARREVAQRYSLDARVQAHVELYSAFREYS